MNNDLRSKIEALDRSQAVIEFDTDGAVLTANRNFLAALGYELSEIQGKHHSLFVEPAFRESQDYKAFWSALAAGTFQSGEFKRIGKGGREIWLQATYNPILGRNGKIDKIVKFSSDITERVMRSINNEGQIKALDRSQAVIEFALDGAVLTANRNFLDVVGYDLSEIQGRHHSMFVDPDLRTTAEYRRFWDDLGRGEYQADEYRRNRQGRPRGLHPGDLQSDPRPRRTPAEGPQIRHRRDAAGAGAPAPRCSPDFHRHRPQRHRWSRFGRIATGRPGRPSLDPGLLRHSDRGVRR